MDKKKALEELFPEGFTLTGQCPGCGANTELYIPLDQVLEVFGYTTDTCDKSNLVN